MLHSLNIENIALISKLEVNFQKGLNILSGETGAGKSIIIDSLSFVLGQRADKSLIRYGQDTARVTAVFTYTYNEILDAKLEESGIQIVDDEIILDRIMSSDGKNTCRINGVRCTLNILKGIASCLADIYGQHENVSVLDENKHCFYLDSYLYNDIYPIKQKQKELFIEYKEILKKINEYGTRSNISENIDLLNYQLNELETANLVENEEEDLLARRRKNNNIESILTSLDRARELLSEGDFNTVAAIKESSSLISKISEYDDRIDELVERLDSVKVEITDISATLSEIADDNEYDPNEAALIEERINLIRRLRKKYGGDVADLINQIEKIHEEIDFYNLGEEVLEKLEREKEKIELNLLNNTNKLTKLRKDSANKLSEAITNELKQLGMPSTQFYAQFDSTLNEDDLPHSLSENGCDDICFMFSANSGQPARQLSKVISGGELSRFMLAVKKIFADLDNIDTMVFDEIDTGISGKTAQVVAEKLCAISNNRQVLAITHLPQLASMADAHYLILKKVIEEKSVTVLEKLNLDRQFDELARLIGGKDYSAYSLPLAKEMKQHADDFKKTLI